MPSLSEQFGFPLAKRSIWDAIPFANVIHAGSASRRNEEIKQKISMAQMLASINSGNEAASDSRRAELAKALQAEQIKAQQALLEKEYGLRQSQDTAKDQRLGSASKAVRDFQQQLFRTRPDWTPEQEGAWLQQFGTNPAEAYKTLAEVRNYDQLAKNKLGLSDSELGISKSLAERQDNLAKQSSLFQVAPGVHADLNKSNQPMSWLTGTSGKMRSTTRMEPKTTTVNGKEFTEMVPVREDVQEDPSYGYHLAEKVGNINQLDLGSPATKDLPFMLQYPGERSPASPPTAPANPAPKAAPKNEAKVTPNLGTKVVDGINAATGFPSLQSMADRGAALSSPVRETFDTSIFGLKSLLGDIGSSVSSAVKDPTQEQGLTPAQRANGIRFQAPQDPPPARMITTPPVQGPLQSPSVPSYNGPMAFPQPASSASMPISSAVDDILAKYDNIPKHLQQFEGAGLLDSGSNALSVALSQAQPGDTSAGLSAYSGPQSLGGRSISELVGIYDQIGAKLREKGVIMPNE